MQISSQVAGDSETEPYGPEEGLEVDWSEQLTLVFTFTFMLSCIPALHPLPLPLHLPISTTRPSCFVMEPSAA